MHNATYALGTIMEFLSDTFNTHTTPRTHTHIQLHSRETLSFRVFLSHTQTRTHTHTHTLHRDALFITLECPAHTHTDHTHKHKHFQTHTHALQDSPNPHYCLVSLKQTHANARHNSSDGIIFKCASVKHTYTLTHTQND